MNEKNVIPPRRCWYIACTSAQLGRGPRAARVLEHEIVVYRDGDGRAAALHDRCCHRGVRLSLGRVVDGTLACGYHGWRFDGGGRCVHIPSLVEGRRIAAGCGVPALPCVERCGYVWVWTGGPAEPPGPPPEIPGFVGRRWSQGTVEHACDWLRALENNLDWCHPVFAHRWTHGLFYLALVRGLAAQRFELRCDAEGMELRGPVDASGEPGAGAVSLRYSVPCRAIIAGPGARRIVVHVVPTGPQRCRVEWLVSGRWFGPQIRTVRGEPAIFRQDRVLLESAAAAEADPQWRERSVEADAPTLLLRRIVELAGRGEWTAERAAAEPLRTVQLRS